MDDHKRIIVVIGGTSGIGRAIALKFARNNTHVVIVGRNQERGKSCAKACEAVGATASFVTCNIIQKESVQALAVTLESKYGGVHVLVNSAGLLQSGTRVLDQELDEDDALWATNYRGTFLACQVFGRMMKIRGKGAILNIGSLASFAPLSLPAYTPGKHALLALTQMLAAELGPSGVRVNAVAPGYTNSDGLQAKIAAGERDVEAIKATTALRCIIEPEEVAEAAYFLCSDKARAITGVSLPVDAGWLVQAPYASYLQGNPIKN